jgi:hypothetical protein
MIHGICWGIGQSTLSRRLAEAIPDVDVLWEDELSQPAIFTRAEFAEVADRFHRHNANPDAGIGHPPRQLLEDAYTRLVERAVAKGGTTLLAWSPMDLAEDLDWARADERELHKHAAAVRRILAPLDPDLVYLAGDISVAFERALEQRGRDWFARAYGRDREPWDALVPRLIAEATTAAERIERAFAAGGWFPALEIDATTESADGVFRAAATGLTRRGIVVLV